MKKILVVEDEQRKLEHITHFLKINYPTVKYDECRSYNSALHTIVCNHVEYDLVLLDMSMTTFDVSTEESGGVPEPLAGENILDAIYLNDIPIKVIVVTMYESFVGKRLQAFDIELRASYPENYLGFVFFSHKNKDWEVELKKYMDKL